MHKKSRRQWNDKTLKKEEEEEEEEVEEVEEKEKEKEKDLLTCLWGFSSALAFIALYRFDVMKYIEANIADLSN
ncbi:hypothetical protein H920_11732 [Fukomys damarensis]|uniref:Uncharacterized protein n=1 Tax=Fukomys damarensis TaxID=885580 RepID=A0A091D723_FUKDA|nr:hypothetical protein H920_11732 [Fukomys damarensis]